MRGDLVLLATRSMSGYMERVFHQLQTFPDFHSTVNSENSMGELSTVDFADGEMEVEVHSSLRGKDVFLFSQAGRNAHGLSVEKNKLELYHTIDALKRAAAGRITLFEPYSSSSRSDRTTRRNSVGFWVHHKTLISLGVDHIITYQLHSDKSKTAIDPNECGIDDVPANTLLQEYISDNFIKTQDYLETKVKEDWVFCSVDAGGEGIAKKYAIAFGTKLVIAHKQRDYHKANTVESINILTATPIEAKVVWIVDDMVDTGGSVYALVQELHKRNVAKIRIAAVHPVFSGPAVERLQQLYNEGMLDAVVVTDTLDCSSELRKQLPFLHVVSSARFSAELIMRMHEEKSLSPFFEAFDARRYLASLKLFM